MDTTAVACLERAFVIFRMTAATTIDESERAAMALGGADHCEWRRGPLGGITGDG